MARPSQQSKTVGLIVTADEPLVFFSSADAAEQYLETYDVEDGVYERAWDRSGQPYIIRSEQHRVVIEPDRNRAPEPERLLAELRAYFGGEASGDLESLLARAAPYIAL